MATLNKLLTLKVCRIAFPQFDNLLWHFRRFTTLPFVFCIDIWDFPIYCTFAIWPLTHPSILYFFCKVLINRNLLLNLEKFIVQYVSSEMHLSCFGSSGFQWILFAQFVQKVSRWENLWLLLQLCRLKFPLAMQVQL